MTRRKRYFHRTRISDTKVRHLIKYIAHDMTAVQIASLTGISRVTVLRYQRIVREKITRYCEQYTPMQGEVEADESYFGGRRKGDKRGRGVTNKVPVFGILKRDGKVYTQIIRNASKAEIHPIIKRIVAKDSAVLHRQVEGV